MILAGTNSKRWWGDPWTWGLLLAACLLWLPNLGSSGLLWQDEAETAILARNVLRFGYPVAFDGVHRVNPGLAAGHWNTWAYHPWLSFYLAAAAFWLFGATTVAARLPFALVGIISVVATYRLALRLTDHKAIARLTGLFTLVSVPLILHARQCRYYAPAILGTLWVIWAYAAAREGRRGAWAWLAAGLIVLFHSHHGAFVPTAAALGIHAAWWGLLAAQRRAAAWTLAIVALATLPWLALLNVAQHHGAWSFTELRHHLQFYIRQLNRYAIPLGFFGLMWAARQITPLAWWRTAITRHRERGGLLLLVIAINLLFIIAIPWQRHFRYFIHLLPLLYLLEAACLWQWLGRRRGWLTLVVALLLATDLLHYSAPYVLAQTIPPWRRQIAERHGLVSPQSLLWDYGYELTHRYRGPLEGIIDVLRSRAAPGDTVKTPYDDHAVIFYTGLRVEDLNRFAEPTYPEWIIPRHGWIPGDWFTAPYGQAVAQRYERIETDAPDLLWENRPDPGAHQFRTVTDAPRQLLYRRRDTP